MLELIHVSPNWLGALSWPWSARPGVPERRHGEDPWQPGAAARPRRLTDDLAWLRGALEDPEPHGLRPLTDGHAVVAWVPDDDQRRTPPPPPRPRRPRGRRLPPLEDEPRTLSAQLSSSDMRPHPVGSGR